VRPAAARAPGASFRIGRRALIGLSAVLITACSGAGHTGRQPAAGAAGHPASGQASQRPAAVRMASPAAFRPLDLEFADRLYGYGSAAVQLAAQGSTHHAAQAVRQLAAGMQQVQEGYLRELAGWLRQWGQPLPAPTGPGPAGGRALAPSAAQVRQLSRLAGARYDRLFLRLLTADLRGSLQAALAEQQGGGFGPGRQLAAEVVSGSTAVIVTMRSMLARQDAGAG
jgi:uncharacterized protein (DUF305 family)